MKRLIWISIVFIFACHSEPNPEYKTLKSGIKYKLHQFGDGKSLEGFTDFSLYLLVTDLSGDTLHYVPNYFYFKELKNNSLDSVWRNFNVGDSLSLLLPRKYVNKNFNFYQVLQSDEGKVLLNARILESYQHNEAEIAKEVTHSKRELFEQAELKRYLNQIEEKIDTIEDVLKIIKVKVQDEAPEIKFGSKVSLHYTGRFLNGYIFDNTYNKGVMPTFVYGQEYQLIEGMHLGLNGMKEGESVKIIVPSRRGFGEEGSLAGIVPPYTAVIFDVEIIKVIN
tara:strand:+ start:13916 stop:14755 length:840 start_codon:yes stop_codon:yes gene_type:complete